MLPVWSRLAPDGHSIAYVTQIGVPRVHVISTDGQSDRDLGPARADCPSIWTAADHLWIYQGSDSERHWAEFDLAADHLTGREKEAPSIGGPNECWRDTEGWSSPFFGRARIVKAENSSVRVLSSVQH
jgi:hypothetical protein